jgi:hypothetical protein
MNEPQRKLMVELAKINSSLFRVQQANEQLEELILDLTHTPAEPCECKDFKKAQELKTASDLCGRLLTHNPTHHWRLSNELPAINYCPWCGGLVPAQPLIKS